MGSPIMKPRHGERGVLLNDQANGSEVTSEGYFHLALDPSANSLQITVLKDSFVSKPVDIAVAPL